jgi:hypothetical protein
MGGPCPANQSSLFLHVFAIFFSKKESKKKEEE